MFYENPFLLLALVALQASKIYLQTGQNEMVHSMCKILIFYLLSFDVSSADLTLQPKGGSFCWVISRYTF